MFTVNRSAIIVMTLLPLLHGCQSTQNNQLKKLPEALRTTAVVTYSNFNRNVPQTGTFAWLPGGTHLLNDPRIDGNKLNRFIRHSIIKTMRQKGLLLLSAVPKWQMPTFNYT